MNFCNFIQQRLRADDFQMPPHRQAVAVSRHAAAGAYPGISAFGFIGLTGNFSLYQRYFMAGLLPHQFNFANCILYKSAFGLTLQWHGRLTCGLAQVWRRQWIFSSYVLFGISHGQTVFYSPVVKRNLQQAQHGFENRNFDS